MKVSIIIPFFTNVIWLEEAIESVLNQTFVDYEIIVINDGSMESVDDFLFKYGKKIRYFKTENKGPAHARNFGINEASGEYLAFLDSDDLWLPTKLEKQVKLMDKGNLVWSHTKYSTFENVDDEIQRIYQEVNNSHFKGNVFPKCLVRLDIATPCILIRKSYLSEHKLFRFSEKMRFGQDGYLWILIGIDNPLGYLDENLTYVRRSGGNAVQKARIHLNVRANLNKNLITKIKDYYPKIHIGFLLRFTYLYCDKVNSLIDFLFGKQNLKNGFVEGIARIVYFPAFIIFKKIL